MSQRQHDGRPTLAHLALGAFGLACFAGWIYSIWLLVDGPDLIPLAMFLFLLYPGFCALDRLPGSRGVHVPADSLVTRRLSNGRRRLLAPLDVKVGGEDFHVPVDTETDFSSIPPVARAFVRWSRVDIAGVVHDYLYQSGAIDSRARADWVWYLVARAGTHHANLVQAFAGYLGLRVAGYRAWKRHRREQHGPDARERQRS